MKINYLSIRKNVWKAALWLAIPASMTFFSCKEDIDESNLYTFTGETIQDYLKNRPEQFSSFNYILERIGYDNIMSAYGNYTCFAPDNEAVEAYIDSLYNDKENKDLEHNGMTAPGLEGLTDSLCRDIALIHLLYQKVLSVKMEKDATFSTMLNREISTSIGKNGETMVNTYSALTKMDNELENGVVHEIDHVITRSNNLVLSELEKNPKFSLFTQAVKVCGLEDSLSVLKRDDIIIPQKAGTGKGAGKIYIPEECLVGFTIFAETDDVLKRYNINSIEDLAAYANKVYEKCAYPRDDDKKEGWYDYYRNKGVQVSTGTDYESPYNALNMFIRYHIVKYKVPYSRLVNHYNEVANVPLYEYYETMLPYTLLKVQGYMSNNQIRELFVNRWWMNSTLTDVVGEMGSSDVYKSTDDDGNQLRPDNRVYNENIAALNGYIHPISDMLTYDYDVPHGVLNERMRFDDISLLPEMMTNGLRRIDAAEVKNRNGQGSGSFGGDDAVRLPTNYCEHLVVYNGDNTELYYLPGQAVGWSNYQGDELLCMGPYDFAFRLPPVPEGMYELRMGYTANGNRGMVQIYLGDSPNLSLMTPLDIPVDMRNTPVNNTDGSPDINSGWCDWQKTDDMGVETDASMHNLGWMRGPLYYTVGPGGATIARSNAEDLRRVITRDYFTQGEHWLRFKTVLPKNTSTEFHLDYIEFCPQSVYNNNQYAEDMY